MSEHLTTSVQAAYQLLMRGDAAGAERALRPALAAHPSATAAQALMGLILQSQSRFAEAAACFDAAIKLDPKDAHLHSNFGLMLQMQGRYEEAVASFRHALKLEPGLQGVAGNLIGCLLGAGRGDEAVAEGKRMVSRECSAQAYDALANACRGIGDFEAALAASEEAVRRAPNEPACRYGRALALERLNRNAEAMAEWEALSRAAGSNPDLMMRRAHALTIASRLKEAEALLAEGVGQWPDNVALQGQLARLRWLLGDRAGFARDIENAVRARPELAALRVEAAHLVLFSGDGARAEALLRAAPTMDAGVLKGLVGVMTEQGRVEEALALIDKHPAAALMMERASALLRLGRAKEALEAIRALPQHADTAQQLIAFEVTALRMLGDPAYRRYYDYDALVRAYEVMPHSGDVASFNAELAERLRALHQSTEHPLDQTLRNGTQTSADLRYLPDPVIRSFFAAIDKPIRDYIAALKPDDPVGRKRRDNYRINGSWSVRLRPGGFHGNHIHNAGWVSSAYYVALPPMQGEAGAIKFGEPPWPSINLGPEKIVTPKVGTLVLFPSYMWHGTVPFTDGQERLTIAFDVVPA